MMEEGMSTALQARPASEVFNLQGGFVPEGWYENSLVPWADAQGDAQELGQARAKMKAIHSAIGSLRREELEVVRGIRYLELQTGELLLRYGSEAGGSWVKVHEGVLYRAMASNRQAVLDLISSATEASVLSHSAIRRFLYSVDPKRAKERDRANRLRRERRQEMMETVSEAEQVMLREAQRKAAKRRGDELGKAWELIEKSLRQLDAAFEESIEKEGNGPRSEATQLLWHARAAMQDSWDAVGQAIRVSD